MEGYTPFKMKAKDYGNSPMLMNFPDSFPGGVGGSPAKFGFLKKAAKKLKSLGKKVLGKTAIGKALGIGKEKKDPSMAAADATAAATRPHTHDETGAVVPEAEGPQVAVAETVDSPKSAKEMRKQKLIERLKSGGGVFGGGGASAMGYGGLGGGGMFGRG